MITITCNKCSMESDNKNAFDCARFSYLDSRNYLCFIHLCKDCQVDLQKVEDKAFAEFLGEDEVRDWDRHDGIS